jgi:hypothetical protein
VRRQGGTTLPEPTRIQAKDVAEVVVVKEEWNELMPLESSRKVSTESAPHLLRPTPNPAQAKAIPIE